MKKNNKPASKNVAPAASAENKKFTNRCRRIHQLVKLGLSEEKIQEIFKEENTRMVLCLYYTSFTKEGTRVKKVYKRDEKHHVVDVTETEVKVTLTGRQAAEAFLKENNIEPVALGPTYCYIKTDVEHLDELLETLKTMGRTSVTKPEPVVDTLVEREVKKIKSRKPSGNKNPEKKHVSNKQVRDAKSMRPVYAVLRKMRSAGANAEDVDKFIKERIKKYNPKMAAKIKEFITSRAKSFDLAFKFKNKPVAESKSADNRAKHRQLTAIEMKARKRAKRVARHLVALERLQKRQEEAAVNNAKAKAERAQKAQKPVQTELNMAA